MPRRNHKFLIKLLFWLMVFGLLLAFITIWIAAEGKENATQLLQPSPSNTLIKHGDNNDTDNTRFRQFQNSKLIVASGDKKDWHNYEAMYIDTQRVGIGEQAKGDALGPDTDRALEKNMSLQFGFNALLSDAISVNRSITDKRNKGCLRKTYLAKLPAISVIMPFNNEHFSVLLRSVHSIINRTPPELLKEILLIDDFSDIENLGHQLDQYVAENFDKVQIVHLPERMGLIRARMVGARKATAEVLVILDAHVEVNYNWLPPLLEPIALDKRTAVCPIIDTIQYRNFEYQLGLENGGRGGFDWSMRYIQIKLLPEDMADHTKPYKNPVMNGGLLAIPAEFFWELGGYDEGLDTWGGEQFELSFKIWMCGGQILDAPCSRVGHLFRDPLYGKVSYRSTTLLFRNYKRVAEVWMDEYKNYVYDRNAAYETIDAGDLTKQIAIREKLQCKSFKWFMEVVAFDLTKEYPLVEPPDFAFGAIQSVAFPHLCVDTLNGQLFSKVGLYTCAQNLTHPHNNQKFVLSWRRDIRTFACLEIQDYAKRTPVFLWFCHHLGGNQFWYYDRAKKWLLNGVDGKRCLEASPSDNAVYVDTCKEGDPKMQWNFGFVNDQELDRFFENIQS